MLPNALCVYYPPAWYITAGPGGCCGIKDFKRNMRSCSLCPREVREPQKLLISVVLLPRFLERELRKGEIEVRRWGRVSLEVASLESQILLEHLQSPNTKFEAQPERNCFEHWHDIQVDILSTMGSSQDAGALKIWVPLTAGWMWKCVETRMNAMSRQSIYPRYILIWRYIL